MTQARFAADELGRRQLSGVLVARGCAKSLAVKVVLGILLTAVVCIVVTARAGADVLRVGPGHEFALPSLAATAAKDGDVIEIAGGTYDGDVATWVQNDLVIRGVHGRPHLRAGGAHAAGKGIWVVKGRNTTIENIEFSGARVPKRNGAGIRLEGIGLTVRNCYFHDNENGLLTGGGGEGEVVIEHSEFAANGHGDGRTHNIYIGTVRTFTLRGSYSHHAKVGHNVKSRALINYLLYNRIMDEEAGSASYAVDLPNGGRSYVIGNLVQQGPKSENSTIISYGAEGLKNPTSRLYIVNNTVVNDRPGGGTFIQLWGLPERVRVINNLFVGGGVVIKGAAESHHNILTDRPGLVNRLMFDYRLKEDSPAIDAGIDPGTVDGFSLTPQAEYLHKAAEGRRSVVGRIDIGAHEYESGR